MATRGTYDICGMQFYCHWDNDPEGAAHKLARMIEAHVYPIDDARCFAFGAGGLPYAFIRGVDRAEPYESGDLGGAEYHYTIRPTGTGGHSVTVYERDTDWQWYTSEVLPLLSFINRHQDDLPVVKVEGLETIRPFLATQAHARKIAQALAEEAQQYPESNPNREGMVRAAQAWQRAADGLPRLKRNDYPDLTPEKLQAMADHMADEIRERLHSEWQWQHPGQFLTEYLIHDPGFPLHQFDTGRGQA